MPRKNLAYCFKKQSKTLFNLNFCLSHSHELIAAYFGYSSLASMDSVGVLLDNPDLFDGVHPDDHLDFEVIIPRTVKVQGEGIKDKFNKRANQLKFTSHESLQMFTLIEQLSKQMKVSHLKFNDNYLNRCMTAREEDLSILSGVINKGISPTSVLFKADKPDKITSYWYDKKEKGENLSVQQLEFANEYGELMVKYIWYIRCLKYFADEGDSESIYVLSQLGEYEESEIQDKYIQAAKSGCTSAMSILSTEYKVAEWIMPAAETGCKKSLELLTRSASEKIDFESICESYKLHYLAMLYGYDFTKSSNDYYEYYEGLHLQELSDKLKQRANQSAEEIYEKNIDLLIPDTEEWFFNYLSE